MVEKKPSFTTQRESMPERLWWANTMQACMRSEWGERLCRAYLSVSTTTAIPQLQKFTRQMGCGSDKMINNESIIIQECKNSGGPYGEPVPSSGQNGNYHMIDIILTNALDCHKWWEIMVSIDEVFCLQRNSRIVVWINQLSFGRRARKCTTRTKYWNGNKR